MYPLLWGQRRVAPSATDAAHQRGHARAVVRLSMPSPSSRATGFTPIAFVNRALSHLFSASLGEHAYRFDLVCDTDPHFGGSGPQPCVTLMHLRRTCFAVCKEVRVEQKICKRHKAFLDYFGTPFKVNFLLPWLFDEHECQPDFRLKVASARGNCRVRGWFTPGP